MRNKENTTTDSTWEGTSTDASVTCDSCGEPIETEEWHPTATEWDGDGALSVYTFCSQDCRGTWLDS